MSNQSPLRTLKGTLRGDLIEPGDARYDEVRKVYNGMIDKRPLAIAMCLDVADVSAAVLAGADHGLPVAIRGGGHNAGGLGICDDGLVIDLSHMKQIEVDAAAKTVRVRAARSGTTSTPRRTRTASRCRPASSPPRASAASASAAVSAISLASAASPSTTSSAPRWCLPTARRRP